MKRILCFLGLYILCKSLPGQGLLQTSLSQRKQLTAYSQVQGDIFSFTKNPSALGSLSYAGIGLSSERKYGLGELNYYSLVAALHSASGGFGLEVLYTGSAVYNETSLGLAYGRKLFNHLGLGLQFNWKRLTLPGYGNASGVNIKAGSNWYISEKFQTGFSIDQSVMGKFGTEKKEQWPSAYSMAFGYDISPVFFLATEVEKLTGHAAGINTVMCYRFLEKLTVCAGISSVNAVMDFSICFLHKSLLFCVGSSYQQRLGISPAIMLAYKIKK